MKKLFNYLLKIGIEEKPTRGSYEGSPAEFYRETYGSRYFENAPAFIYEAAVIYWNYTGATAEGVQEFKKQEKAIKTYCKKYGYTCETSYFYGDKTAKIYRPDDARQAENYYYFQDAAIKKYEKIDHYLHKVGRIEKSNAAARLIMQEYGQLYADFLRNTQPA